MRAGGPLAGHIGSQRPAACGFSAWQQAGPTAARLAVPLPRRCRLAAKHRGLRRTADPRAPRTHCAAQLCPQTWTAAPAPPWASSLLPRRHPGRPRATASSSAGVGSSLPSPWSFTCTATSTCSFSSRSSSPVCDAVVSTAEQCVFRSHFRAPFFYCFPYHLRLILGERRILAVRCFPT